MLSRLLMIGFLLCLPIAVALLSQQATRTIAPPQLPADEVTVKLSGGARARRGGSSDAQGHEVPHEYVPRVVGHVQATDAADESMAAEEAANKLANQPANGTSQTLGSQPLPSATRQAHTQPGKRAP